MKKLRRPALDVKKSGPNGAKRESSGRRNARSPIHGPRHPKTELEAAIQRFVDLYDFAPVAYVSFDRAGRIEEANLAATELLGESRDLLIGRPFAFYVADLDSFQRHLLHCRTSEQKVETELELKTRKGERIPAQLLSTPVTSTAKNGELLYQTSIIDLRESKAAEAKLRASEQRYRTLFDLVPVAVYACDAQGGIKEFNRRAVELWGRKPSSNSTTERFCGSFKIYYPDGRFMPHEECPMARALRGEELKPGDLEILVERNDGQRRNVVVAPRTFTNANGQVIGAINCLYDITERKRAEERIRESEERLRAIINQSNAGMASCDLKGRFSFANEKFCKMLGYAESELQGKTIFAITHPQDVDITRRRFAEMLREKRPVEMEKRYTRKDGSFIWANVCDTPVLDATGKVASAVAVAIDITERKKAEAALQKSKSVLEQRVKERTRELRAANQELERGIERRKGLEEQILEISDREQQRLGQELHDGLCQQLTAIGFMARSTALRLKNHRVAQVEDLEKIAQLINNSVMDARNIARDLYKEEVDAAGFVNALQTLTQRKIWSIPCRFDLKTELKIEEDKVASEIYRILREALLNANKHSGATQVGLEVRRRQNDLIFSVTDNGVGFRTKTKAGHGLGLHIMQYRAQSIGAHLRLESPRNGGSRVVCSLPNSK
jgi:PAS domain S-box-containing protein